MRTTACLLLLAGLVWGQEDDFRESCDEQAGCVKIDTSIVPAGECNSANSGDDPGCLMQVCFTVGAQGDDFPDCRAPEPPVCGNGRVESGEDCEPGIHECCNEDCSLKGSGVLCRTAVASASCDVADYCDGISPDCPDIFEPSTKVCRESCCRADVVEMCTGTSAFCPEDLIGGFDLQVQFAAATPTNFFVGELFDIVNFNVAFDVGTAPALDTLRLTMTQFYPECFEFLSLSLWVGLSENLVKQTNGEPDPEKFTEKYFPVQTDTPLAGLFLGSPAFFDGSNPTIQIPLTELFPTYGNPTVCTDEIYENFVGFLHVEYKYDKTDECELEGTKVASGTTLGSWAYSTEDELLRVPFLTDPTDITSFNGQYYQRYELCCNLFDETECIEIDG